MKKFSWIALVLALALLPVAGCNKDTASDLPAEGEAATAVYQSQSVAVADVAADFAPYLEENEFVGHAVSSDVNGEAYLIGLVYSNAEGMLSTPLTATLLLKQDGTEYTLVKRDIPTSTMSGGFEEPIGSGYYDKTVIDTAHGVLISTEEATFSEYNVVHQVLMNTEGLLDFAEYEGVHTDFVELDGAWYSSMTGSYQQLDTTAGGIAWQAVDVAALRPQTAEGDLVIEVAGVDLAAGTLSFTVNGVAVTAEQWTGEEAMGMIYTYNGALTVERGKKIWLIDNADAATSAHFWDAATYEEIPITTGVGYQSLDTTDAPAAIELFSYYYVDSGYSFPITIE